MIFVESPQTVWSGFAVKRNVRAKVPFVTLIARLQFAGIELLVFRLISIDSQKGWSSLDINAGKQPMVHLLDRVINISE